MLPHSLLPRRSSGCPQPAGRWVGSSRGSSAVLGVQGQGKQLGWAAAAAAPAEDEPLLQLLARGPSPRGTAQPVPSSSEAAPPAPKRSFVIPWSNPGPWSLPRLSSSFLLTWRASPRSHPAVSTNSPDDKKAHQFQRKSLPFSPPHVSQRASSFCLD